MSNGVIRKLCSDNENDNGGVVVSEVLLYCLISAVLLGQNTVLAAKSKNKSDDYGTFQGGVEQP